MAGLIVAEASARAAHAIWPRDDGAAELAKELERFWNNARLGAVPSFRMALATLASAQPERLLGAQPLDRALELEQVALSLEKRSYFRLALLQTESVARIFRSELGASARQSLRVRIRRVRLLLWVGRTHDALADIEDIAPVLAHALGADHPETLLSRRLLAHALDSLGRPADALPVIEEVAAKQANSPNLGPEHPDTLASRRLLAHVLDSLGRPADALRVIEEVAAKQANSDPCLAPESTTRN